MLAGEPDRSGSQAGTARSIDRRFVGRERELGQLLSGLEEASAGRAGLMTVSGGPGIGKTRLVDEFGRLAADAGARVCWGRCWADVGAPAYWPWIQVLRDLCSWPLPEVGPDVMGAIGILGRALPESGVSALASVPPCGFGVEPPYTAGEGGEHARFALFDAVGTLLGAAAGQAEPAMVVILDDLHAADRPSLLLLAFLARARYRARLLIVGTHRDFDATGPTSLLAQIATSWRGVPLREFSGEELSRLIEARTGARASRDVVDWLGVATGGIPFLADELLSVAIAEGRIASRDALAAMAVPDGVRQAVRNQLAALPQKVREVLSTASVLGSEFDTAILVELCGGPEPVDAALELAVTARLVLPSAGPIGRRGFAHALVRDVLYDDVAPNDRAARHARAGRAIEARHGAQSQVYELARHYLRALGAGEARAAVRCCTLAAQRSMARLGYEEAADHLRSALGALDFMAEEADAPRGGLLVDLGEALRACGETEAAQEAFSDAADHARRHGDTEVAVRAALGYGQAWVDIGTVDRRLVELLDRALEMLGPLDTAPRSMVLARLAEELYYAGGTEPMLAHAREALDIARRLDDPLALCRALGARHLMECWSPAVGERLDLAHEMVARAERSGDQEGSLAGRVWRVMDLAELSDQPALVREVEDFSRWAEAARRPSWLWYPALWRAMSALDQARLDEAEALIAAALVAGEGVHPDAARATFGMQLFALRAEQGRLGELEGAVDDFADRYPAVPAWRAALAFLLAELGRLDECRAQLDRLAADGFATLPADRHLPATLVLLAEVCRALGDSARATALYRLLGPYAAQRAIAGPAAVGLGPVARPLGVLATLAGYQREAEAHFTAAMARCEATESVVWTAHTRFDYACLLAERNAPGDGEWAVELLERAAEVAAERGLVVLAERVAAQVAAVAGAAALDTPLDIALDAVREPVAPPRRRVLASRAPAQAPPAGSRGSNVIRFPGPTGSTRPTAAAGLADNVYRREGEYWTLAFAGLSVRLRHTQGLGYIARLLATPGREVHALDLAAPGSRRVEHVPGLGDAGEVLDARARSEYRRRLADLGEDLEEARAWADGERAARAQAEIDTLTAQLAGAFGIGGRRRPAGSASERARVSVTRAVRRDIGRIAGVHGPLGAHLGHALRTGTYCCYDPDPAAAVAWAL